MTTMSPVIASQPGGADATPNLRGRPKAMPEPPQSRGAPLAAVQIFIRSASVMASTITCAAWSNRVSPLVSAPVFWEGGAGNHWPLIQARGRRIENGADIAFVGTV